MTPSAFQTPEWNQPRPWLDLAVDHPASDPHPAMNGSEQGGAILAMRPPPPDPQAEGGSQMPLGRDHPLGLVTPVLPWICAGMGYLGNDP